MALCKSLLALSVAAAGMSVVVAAEQKLEPLPDAEPPPPPNIQSGETLEPDITITRKGEETVEEYRIKGHLYMVKITPKVGKPYYLVDQNGDGTMETRMSQLYSNFVVPQWVLLSW